MRRGITHLHRLAVLVLAMLVLFTSSPASAHAEGTDSITNLDTRFDVHADGTMSVRYRVDYVLGGSHGLLFGIQIREPWIGENDVVYRVSDIKVSSPTGAPAKFSRVEKNVGRSRMLQLRIGDPHVTLTDRNQTYEVSYTLAGGLRTVAEGPQLNWDVTTRDMPSISQASITVTGPAAITQAKCEVYNVRCTSTRNGQSVRFQAAGIRADNPLTVVAQFPSGSVQNATPRLKSHTLATIEEALPSWLGIIGVIVGLLLLGRLIRRVRLIRDERAPMTAAGGPPVYFAVPDADLALAGLLLDRRFNNRHASALLTQLAVVGRVELTRDEEFKKPPRMLKTKRIGGKGKNLPKLAPIESKALSHVPQNGTLDASAARSFLREIKDYQSQTVRKSPLVHRPSKAQTLLRRLVILVPALAAILVGLWFRFFGQAEHPVASTIFGWPLVIGAVAYVFSASDTTAWGLTSAGAELRDQVLGFKTYLGRAEADQLRHDAATEHYTKLLPWAVLFKQSARWQKICDELVAAGDVNASDLATMPSNLSASDFSHTLSSTFSSASSSSSGGGSGGSGTSGFSSGGGGGSGGGGVSMSSW